MEVVGRNADSSWLYIQDVSGWNPCWIKAALVKFNTTSDIFSVQVVYSKLPFSNQYNIPEARAARTGNEVTISWKAVWMSIDDYRGYLIEAWLCQDGAQKFIPISYIPPITNNTGVLSVKVTDERECNSPSRARVYSAEKHGYSDYQMIFWP